MKNKLLFALTTLGLVLGTVSCNPADSSTSETVVFDFDVVGLRSENKEMLTNEVDYLKIKAVDDGELHAYTYVSSNPEIVQVDETGMLVSGSTVGEAVITVTEEDLGISKDLKITVVEETVTGVSYASESYEEKGKILGKLEKYAMDEFLTGFSLFENGGYVMYNPRIQKGTENYITGYGFGILAEGRITKPLEKETNAAWKNYYHQISANDPLNINAWDNDGSEVSDLYANISSSYYGTKMNASKDGYEWYPVLAADDCPRPIPLNEDPVSHFATKWRVKVKTGKDGLVYDTNSTKYASFKGREVKLEDYLFPYQMMFTGGFDLFRGAEKASDDSYGFVGAAKYFNQTKGKKDIDYDLFNSSVHINLNEAESAIEFELVKPVSKFYAMYALSSNLFQPIPKDFLMAIGGNTTLEAGVKNFGTFNKDLATTPVDNTLSLAPYTLELWEKNKTIVFKRNPSWVEFKNEALKHRYSIEGVHYNVLKAANEDPEAVFKEFIAEKIDAAGIPTNQLAKYRGDPRTTQTTGDSVFKLNVNSCDEERWEELFGEHGTVAQTPKSKYYAVKPWMSNKNFLKGLNFSIDRDTFATNRGSIASQNYFSSNYLIDPEAGVPYNTTAAHKEAMKNYAPETMGYNLEVAKEYFKEAVKELVAEGKLVKGTTDNPTIIDISIVWQAESNVKEYGEEIGKYFEDAFNHPSVADGLVKLKVENKAVAVWSDVYYKHCMVGQFDLGFGSISGNSLDPLNFMEVLKSDNSSGFTLNWGADTSKVSPTLDYDGRKWSYDSLWLAADSGMVINQHCKSVEPVMAALDKASDLVHGKLNVVWMVRPVDNVAVTLKEISIYVMGAEGMVSYTLDASRYTLDAETGLISIVLTADDIDAINKLYVKANTGEEWKEGDPVENILTMENAMSTWLMDLVYDLSIDGKAPSTKDTVAIPLDLN